MIRAVDSEDSDASADEGEGRNSTTDDSDARTSGSKEGSPKKRGIPGHRKDEKNGSTSSLDGILALHTARRMKVAESPEKAKRGG